MTDQGPNADQATFWDSQAGPKWVRHADAMDACLAPVTEAVLEAATLRPWDHVLDIGCGAGHSTFAAIELLTEGGRIDGFDISRTLLALARDRARGNPATQFILGDAETYDFVRGAYDALISRFGVMFFASPVTAFANMARALRPGARVAFAAWGQIRENPFFTLPATAVRVVLGDAPPRPDPEAPGPFAFQNTDRVCRILKEAGFVAVEVEVQNIPLPIAGGAKAATALFAEIGPIERAFLHFDTPPEQQIEVLEEVSRAASALVKNDQLMIPSEINIYTARAYETP